MVEDLTRLEREVKREEGGRGRGRMCTRKGEGEEVSFEGREKRGRADSQPG
jgi:hypothetical protein